LQEVRSTIVSALQEIDAALVRKRRMHTLVVGKLALQGEVKH
jgi:hypothetical protein